jgi:purine-binding chemotaxis protein CheW
MADVTRVGLKSDTPPPQGGHSGQATQHVLLVRAGPWICALPITDVIETMRPLPVRPVEGGPPFLQGVAIIRGELLPVVRLSSLLHKTGLEKGGRFVTVRTGSRQIALQVDAVIGAKHIDLAALSQTPPLLSEALSEHAEKIGSLDGEMTAMLRMGRIFPENLLATVLGEAAG